MWIRPLIIAALALLAIGAGLPSNRLYLSGSVRFTDKPEVQRVEGLYLFVKAGGHVVAATYVDSDGAYNINFIPEQQPSFDFYYAGLGDDTTFIRSFTEFESDLTTWDIEL